MERNQLTENDLLKALDAAKHFHNELPIVFIQKHLILPRLDLHPKTVANTLPRRLAINLGTSCNPILINETFVERF